MKYCQASGANRSPQRAADLLAARERAGRLRVRVALREFVQRADVVEVVVRRDRGQRLIEEIGRGGRQAHDAEPAVDEHRAVTTAYEPYVAAGERVHVPFPEVPRAVVEPAAREPRIGSELHERGVGAGQLRPQVAPRQERDGRAGRDARQLDAGRRDGPARRTGSIATRHA